MFILVVLTAGLGFYFRNRMSPGILAGLLTVFFVVGSVFVPTALGYGAWLLGTLPGSPVIFGIIYLALKVTGGQYSGNPQQGNTT